MPSNRCHIEIGGKVTDIILVIMDTSMLWW